MVNSFYDHLPSEYYCFCLLRIPQLPVGAMSFAKPLDEHDPSLQFDTAWQDLPPPKTPRFECGTAMWGSDKIIVVGGYGQGNWLSSVEIYDISSCEWMELPPLSQPKRSCTAIVVNDKLYVFGGYSRSYLSECEVLDLSQPDSQFTRLPNDLPQAFSHAVAVSKGHWIYVIGGWNNGYLNTVYALDTRTNQWNDKLPPMKEKRQFPAVAILDDTLVVAGGCNKEYLKSVETLDLKTSKWTNTIQSMPSPRDEATAFVEQGSSNLIIAGGNHATSKPVTTYLRYNGNSWTEYENFPPMTGSHGFMVVAASRKCLYYVDLKRKFKGLSFTTNETVAAVHFGPDPKELQRLEEAEQRQKAEAERKMEEEDRNRKRQQEEEAQCAKKEIAAEVERQRKQLEAEVVEFRRQEEEEEERKRSEEDICFLGYFFSAVQRLTRAARRKEEEDRPPK